MNNKVNIFGIISLVLAVVSLPFICIVLSFLPALIGLIIGIVGLFFYKRGKVFCIIGIVINSIIMILSIVIFVSININLFNNEESNSKTTANIETTMQEETTANIETTMQEETATKEETTIKEEVTEVQTEKELTEDEYKTQCKELYYDDFFNNDIENNTLVKFYGFTSEKFKYHSTDLMGIVVDDITEKYELEWNCLGCCVLHKETKDDTIKSYFGKSVYLMFQKDGAYNLDSYKAGEYIIVYGEVIQNRNGIFILPKYIEYQ